MTTGERMKNRRKQLGLSAEDLAALLGKSAATIYRYENGAIEKMPGNILLPISKVLHTTPDYLMGWSDEAEAPNSEVNPAREIDPIYDALNASGKKELCRYGRYLTGQNEYKAAEAEPQVDYIRHYLTAAAAGYAAPIEGEDYDLVPRGADVPYSADFCIDIDGDSMEPYIANGQRVYVQRDTSMQEFDVGIFYVDGDVYCKQWCRDYAGTLHLLSANPRRRDANIDISKDSGRNVVCFGKVLLGRKLPAPEYV